MGTILNLDTAASRQVADGVNIASLVGGAGRQVDATVLHVAPGAKYQGEVPRGSDQYLFVMAGDVTIEAAGTSTPMAKRSFALIEEGKPFTLTGGGEAAKLLSVVVPPAGTSSGLAGFRGGCKVMAVSDLPVLDVPEQLKRRTFLATHETVGSERGHAMIVEYTGDTVTKRHHHPNAESMFVFLEGKVRFLVNGEEVVLGPGQAVHFPMSDSHGLRSADGNGLNFLEFHVPGAFVTKLEE